MLLSLDQIRKQEGVNGARLFASIAQIDELVGKTVDQLRAIFTELPDNPVGAYIGHSGGKDSGVIHWLMHMAFPGNHIPVVHTPKTAGPNKVHPETIHFLYTRPFPILHVPAEFHAEQGFKLQVDGSRRDEYSRTDGRSTTVVIDGKDVSREHMTMYVKNGLFGLDFVYPIVDWSNEDVWACIHKNRIEVSPEYLVLLEYAK